MGVTRVFGTLLVACGAGAMLPAVPAANQASQPGAATFTKDVLPILQRSCQRCHRPGTAAPMSLLTYEDARPWARAIKDRVVRRQMPPWHIDRTIGTYLDDPSLGDEEIGIIAKWTDAGAPRGNPADAPPPLKLSRLDGWSQGEPDLVVEVKQGFDIPAEGADIYPTELVDPRLTEDRYVKWVQILTAAPCCLHHSHVYAVLPDDADREGLGLGMGSNRSNEVDLTEFVMGNEGDSYPDGMGKKLPKGSMFRFEAHYHPWGEAKHDRQKVGIKFYPKGVVPSLVVSSHRLRTGGGNEWDLNRVRVEDALLRAGYPLELDEPRLPVGSVLGVDDTDNLALLSIPPNTVARHERFYPLPKPAMVISFQPHMHFRGSRMLLEAIHADGRREVLTDATHFQQAWQINYRYKVPHLFPAGTILHVVSWHDNTANNRSNPDPSAWVGWGARTMDEMGQGWTDIAWLTEAQYLRELSARKAQKAETVGRPFVLPLQAQSQPIYPAYDGYVKNPDGTLLLSFAYFSHNPGPVTVLTGPNNSFAPAPADRQQPTTFHPGHHRFQCIMVVGPDFGGALRWTLSYGGSSSSTSEKMLQYSWELEEGSRRQVLRGLDVANAPKGVCLNRPPVVRVLGLTGRTGAAPAGLSVTLPQQLRVFGSVDDEGLPRGSMLTVAWRKVSGPGTVTFADPSAARTHVSFSAAGTYQLELWASDSLLDSRTVVTVTVNPEL